MAVLITDDHELLKMPLESFRQVAQALLNELGSPEGELSILITDDENIAAINRDYFNRPWPTNVISFSMMEGEFADVNPEAKMLGDIVISIETAEREAVDADMPVEENIVRLLVHGLLHIFGYDHEAPDADAERMARKSEQLIETLKSERLLE